MLQKVEAPPTYASQLHAPPASYSTPRLWREKHAIPPFSGNTWLTG